MTLSLAIDFKASSIIEMNAINKRAAAGPAKRLSDLDTSIGEEKREISVRWRKTKNEKQRNRRKNNTLHFSDQSVSEY